MSVKPIETVYKGYRFRSRLEARWAVFFDALGAEWEYEPEGFVLEDGTRYLPDFRLRNVAGRGSEYETDLWIEVKGKMTTDDAHKIKLFGLHYEENKNGELNVKGHRLLVLGQIPTGDDFHARTSFMWDQAYSGTGEVPYNLEHVDFDYFCGFLVMDENSGLTVADEYWYKRINVDVEATERAYRAAQQARFEHGEKPDARR